MLTLLHIVFLSLYADVAVGGMLWLTLKTSLTCSAISKWYVVGNPIVLLFTAGRSNDAKYLLHLSDNELHVSFYL